MLIPQDRVIVTSGPLTGFEGVVERVDATRVSLKLDFISRNTTVRLKPHALKLVARVLSPETISSIREISEEIIRQLAKRPEDLYALTSRRFEEIICELFQDFGYDAHLTPQTRDGGRDVLAVLSTPMGKELTIVECKRYKKSVKIGVDVVQRLLWVARDEDKASCAVLATTSSFSSGAKALERKYQWILKLKDFGAIVHWLRMYGRWQTTSGSGVWTPRR